MPVKAVRHLGCIDKSVIGHGGEGLLDDFLMNSADLSTTINKDSEGENPFLEPQYIIINLAIGGTAGGDPSGTIFPAFYEIDYVRVYQK